MRFQVYIKPKDRKYYFKLRARNGWPLLSSLPHEDKEKLMETINKVRRSVADDDQYERKTAKNGRLFYEIKEEGKTPLAVSRLYASRTTMERGIKRVKVIAPKAEIVESRPIFIKKKAKPKKREEV